MTAALVLILAYAIGALPFAYVLARRWAGVDVRRAGSGNVGATNVLRTSGPGLAAIVLLLDIAKGAVAVWLAQRVASMGMPLSDVSMSFNALVAAAGLAAILGHVYPVWLRFSGGKGVATACGVFAVLAPRALIAAVGLFALVAWLTRYVSLGSIAGAIALPFAAAAFGEARDTLWAAWATTIIVVMGHVGNLKRVWAGTEPRVAMASLTPPLSPFADRDEGGKGGRPPRELP